MTIERDRISPISTLLDEVVSKSSLTDMRSRYFPSVKHFASWLLLSDYYLSGEKVNKVITFTALPYAAELSQLQCLIRSVAPHDIKHTRTVNGRFIELLRQLPTLTFSFLFSQRKYFAWNDSSEFQNDIAEYCDILRAYVEFWRKEMGSSRRLDRLSKNIEYVQNLLNHKKQIRLLCEAFLISLLGGYVGSVLCRETALTHLCWMSDRDRTNEVGDNLVRDFFQITLIDIVKKNIEFSFTTANSDSDEWYADLVRIPDYLTGTLAGFDFDGGGNHTIKAAAAMVLGAYVGNNRSDCFTYRFVVNDEGMKVQRVLVFKAT